MGLLALFEFRLKVVWLSAVLWVWINWVNRSTLCLFNLVIVTFFPLLSAWGRFLQLVAFGVFVNNEFLVFEHLFEPVILEQTTILFLLQLLYIVEVHSWWLFGHVLNSPFLLFLHTLFDLLLFESFKGKGIYDWKKLLVGLELHEVAVHVRF